MDITLTMLLDLALPDHAFKNEALRSGDRGPSGASASEQPLMAENLLPVRGIRIFGDKQALAAGAGRDLLFLKKQKTGVLFLCGGEKIPLETELTFAEVFNKLEETFIRLRDWDMQLHQGIIEKKGLQYMLDVSEDIFRRPMAITDSGHKLIAYSKSWRGSGDPIFHSLVEKGYMPADAVDQLDKAGFIFEKDAIAFRRGIKGLSYPMLNGTIFVEHDYRYMLTLLLPDGALHGGVYELFSFLRGQILLYVETNSDVSRIRRFAWLSLLSDLVEGKCSPEEFSERNRYSGLPEEKSFRLISIRREDGVRREFIRDRLEQALPEEIVFSHGDDVLILLTEKPGQDMPDPGYLLSVIPFAADKSIYVSISDRFDAMTGLNTAYAQTKAALELGLRVSRNRILEKLGIASKAYDENVFRYSDYYPYDLISASPSLAPAFRALLAEDEKTASGNLRLLYSYLKNDCSKTRTAAELFMHRNNIIYRIGKLEESLGLSLSDESVKTALRLSFLALELMKRQA